MKNFRAELRDLHICFIPLSGFLFALGGWGISKAIRRVGIPGVGGVLALAYGVAWWRCLAYGLATWGALSLGYSPDRHGLTMIAVCGALYGATPLLLGFRWSRVWWPVAGTVAFVGMTVASLEGWIPWKSVEISCGIIHGTFVTWTIDKADTKSPPSIIMV